MLLINRKETDPYFNIAAEEYVLKNFNEDVFMLWVNQPSVIIGKHQVAVAEADIIYAHINSIPIIRRISGGGTVYHDLGNLNYSLLVNGKSGQLVDYKKYAGTVIRALARQMVEASLQGKSNLVVEGKKFSGNAEHVHKKRVLHHGTLLFNTDLEILRKCIRPEHKGYEDKSVRSADSSITNLSDHLPDNFNIHDLKDLITEQARHDFPGIKEYTFSRDDLESIQKLADEKYKTIEWNYGYSPGYKFQKSLMIAGRMYGLELESKNGRIHNISLSGEQAENFNPLFNALSNAYHHPEIIEDIILNPKFANVLSEKDATDFILGIF